MLLTSLVMSQVGSTGAPDGWQASSENVAREMERHPGLIYREEEVPDYVLPPVLKGVDGAPVDSVEAWRRNREILLEAFRTEMYGRRPGLPEELEFETLERVSGVLGGRAEFERIAVRSRQGERTHQFEFGLYLPAERAKSIPAVILIDFGIRGSGSEQADPDGLGFRAPRAVLERGYAGIVFQYGDIAPDHPDRYTEGAIRLFEGGEGNRPEDATRAIAAWGWGASRAMDFLESDDRIDSARVAVVGVSRNGKAALWAAAEDERFDIAISMMSGCGGAALSRRRYGETVRIINRLFPHWFVPRFERYNDNEEELPIDQHQLVALIAPRGVYIQSADEDLWADPLGEYLSLAHGSAIYTLWGYEPLNPEAMPGLREPIIAGPLGYHIREGGHRVFDYDWQRILDFAQQRWESGLRRTEDRSQEDQE